MNGEAKTDDVWRLTPQAEQLDIPSALQAFQKQGFARLGPVFSSAAVAQLVAASQRLTQSESPVPGVFYQHDSPTGRYEDLAFNAGWVGPSSRYRKLERLERVPIFLAWLQNPLFRRLTRAALGDAVFLYRAVLWNKAPSVGMAVPWHQDDGKFWGLDRPPTIQVWTALDHATPESGCLEVVPGSHLGGLASSEGGTVTEAALLSQDAASRAIALPAEPGECILVHNHTWHRTGRNTTAVPRRAISVSFLDEHTRCTRKRRQPRVFRRLFKDEGSSW